MVKPATPANEKARLEALWSMALLDTPRESSLDHITDLAAQLFDVSIVLVSLVDEKRQWFKASHGLDARETSREISFCGHAILQSDVFYIPDARIDPRFANNPLVTGAPHIRFYAGKPIHAPTGEPLGTLCLMDNKPREFNRADRNLLSAMAGSVEQILAMRLTKFGSVPAVRVWLSILITAIAAGLFEFFSSQVLFLPNPPAVLIASVVFASFYGGMRAGLISAAIAWSYFALFFSVPGHPFQYTEDNLLRLLVWAVATPGIAVMTGILQQRSTHAARMEKVNAILATHLADRVAASGESERLHERIRLVTDHAPTHIAYFDENWICGYCNAPYRQWFGLAEEHVVGKPVREIIGEASFATFEPYQLRAATGQEVKYQSLRRHDDGTMRTIDVTLTPRMDEDGQFDGCYTFFNDITEQKKAAEEVQRSQERLARALEGARLALFEAEVQSGNIFLSEGWAEMIGAAPGTTQTTVGELIEMTHPDDQEEVWRVAMEALSGKRDTYEIEHRVKHCNGAWIWILSRARVVERDANGLTVKMSGTNLDFTERKHTEQRLHYVATRDALTELGNRAVFGDALQIAIQQAEQWSDKAALISIGIDRFTTVNDSLGQHAGDTMLKVIAKRIANVVGSGAVVARPGGDEFLVLLRNVETSPKVTAVAEDIRAAICQPIAVDGHELVVTASVGVALFPDDADSAGLLLRNADIALHSAKDTGRDNVKFFSAQMNDAARKRQEINIAMRLGLERDEFVLHYQPQIDFFSGAVIGFEALVRWQHPNRGLLLPREFVPISEAMGLIFSLGDWVLAEACRQGAHWQHISRTPIRVAVNVTASQFRRKGFLKSIVEALDSSGLDPQSLELELTEDTIMEHGSDSISILNAVRHLGVKLAIDDFGTGYSSLSYLKRLPVDTVKIDQSFIADLPADAGACAIVCAIIGLAHNLGLKALAEGVETEEQSGYLRAQGCDYAQGYFFSRPQPPALLQVGTGNDVLSLTGREKS